MEVEEPVEEPQEKRRLAPRAYRAVDGCCYELGVLFVGVLVIRALYMRAPVFWKLPHCAPKQWRLGNPEERLESPGMMGTRTDGCWTLSLKRVLANHAPTLDQGTLFGLWLAQALQQERSHAHRKRYKFPWAVLDSGVAGDKAKAPIKPRTGRRYESRD